MEAPTKYDTVINLKTAKVLGLDGPPACSISPYRWSCARWLLRPCNAAVCGAR